MRTCVLACVLACMHACACVCVRACVHACVYVCVCVSVCVCVVHLHCSAQLSMFNMERRYRNKIIMCLSGDDAMGVQWMDIDSSLQLYASHVDFLHQTAQKLNASW